VTALVFAPSAFADDGGDSGFEGSAAVGAHVSDVEDELVKVREFDLGRDVLQPDMWVYFLGYSGDNRVEGYAKYHDERTMIVGARVDANRYVKIRHNFRSFHHWLDHDLLENLSWREKTGVDSAGNDIGGGKMLTHEDTDPMGMYGVRYSEAKHQLDVKAPQVPGAKIHAEYRSQRRWGEDQFLGVDHCANCHVRSQRGRVNEETRDFKAGVSADVSGVVLSYDFSARDYENLAMALENYYQEARHPANGGSQEEFASRSIYHNDTLRFAATPDVEKRGHSVKVKADLPKAHTVSGTFSLTTTENDITENVLSANVASIAWYAPLTPKLRVAASAVRREIENDDVEIDLPNWRAGRPGGDHEEFDFDWTRMSAYNREEYLGNVSALYAVKPGHTIRLDYRLRSTDRENVELDPESPDETITLQNKIKASWGGRLSGKARSRVSVEYELTDFPFLNVRGLCEEALSDTGADIGGDQPNDWVYYFQRKRTGSGTNQPTAALRAKAYLSYSPHAKTGLTGYINFASEKNDELNAYEWERTALSPGASMYFVPSKEVVVSAGAEYSKIESNAYFCATVMDG
jgi:hypothetical protein